MSDAWTGILRRAVGVGLDNDPGLFAELQDFVLALQATFGVAFMERLDAVLDLDVVGHPVVVGHAVTFQIMTGLEWLLLRTLLAYPRDSMRLEPCQRRNNAPTWLGDPIG